MLIVAHRAENFKGQILKKEFFLAGLTFLFGRI